MIGGWGGALDEHLLVNINFPVFNPGTMGPGLSLQTEPLGPVKLPSMGRSLGRELESPTTPVSFPNSSPVLQGLSLPLLGNVLGVDGSTLSAVSNFYFFMCSVLKGVLELRHKSVHQ